MQSPEAPRSRVPWVDFAKGICIFLVVMLHTTHFVEEDRWDFHSWLSTVVEFARPFRMPDFFLIAGLFLSRVIDRPWRRYLDTKVVHFYYFYFLWFPIIFLFMAVRISAMNDWHGAEDLVWLFFWNFFDPIYPLWFIHSLPIYFVVCKLVRRVPWWIVLTIAAALEIADIHTRFIVPDQFAMRFVYFYSGYIFAPQIFRIAGWALDRRWGAVLYLAVWGVMEQSFVAAGWSQLPGVSLFLGYTGALAVIFIACLLCRFPWMDWLRYLGQHSIVVYLGFMIPMVGFNWIFRHHIGDTGTAALLVTLCAVGGTILMYRAADRTFLRCLYKRPAWARIQPEPSGVYPRAPAANES